MREKGGPLGGGSLLCGEVLRRPPPPLALIFAKYGGRGSATTNTTQSESGADVGNSQKMQCFRAFLPSKENRTTLEEQAGETEKAS